MGTAHHVHPTPVHIRACCEKAMYDAAKRWEAQTGLMAPLAWMLKAMNDGVTQACREHNEGA